MTGEHIRDLWDGRVKVSIWKNVNDGIPFYSAKAVKRYQDKDGEWQDTFSFGRNDMLVVSRLMEQANDITRELENADRKIARGRSKEAVAA